MIYAIDFGTSNSLMGAADGQRVHELVGLDPLNADPTIFRSLLYFHPENGVHFGSDAISKYLENSMQGRFLKSMKRFLPEKSFEETLINGKYRKLEELVSCFLREMRERANAFYKTEVDSVVLGRPARFSDDPASDQLAEKRLLNAAKLAGFNHVELLPEPVAAAYSFRSQMTREQVVLVADFGGGTSDYTLLTLSPKEFQPSDVVAIGGVAIAGDILDGQIMRHRVAKNFGSECEYRLPMSNNILQMPKGLMGYLCSTAHINFLNSRENREFIKRVQGHALKPEDSKKLKQLEILLEDQLGFSVFEAIESAKKNITLSGRGEVSFEYPGVSLDEKLSEKQFADYCQSEVTKIFASLDETLKRAGLSAKNVDLVCCTGGTAKVGLVHRELTKRFGEDKLKLFRQFSSIVEGLSERGRQLLNSRKT